LKNYIIFFFLFIFITSCTSEGDKNIPLYTVTYKNFENTLRLDGQVEALHSTTLSCPRELQESTIGNMVEDGVFVKAGDVLCVLESQQAQTSFDNATTELEIAEADLATKKANAALEYSILEAQVESNDASLQIAQLDSLQLEYMSDNQRRIREMEIQQIEIENARLKKKLKALAIIQRSDILASEKRIERRTIRVQTEQEKLDGLIIRAPKDGLLLRGMNYRYRDPNIKFTVGDIVWGGVPLMNIPELEVMKIKFSVPETDWKSINVNDSVDITFDAMPENRAQGKITLKMPVGQPYKEGSKVKFFEVEASIDTVDVMPKPGMSARCTVFLKQVRDTLIVPQVAIFEEDSVKVVYVKNKKGFETRVIETGITSPQEAVIVSGLQDKEEVALIKPKKNIQKIVNTKENETDKDK
jgi:multidrug efflux pump subunit AcrA (membrane-fusion protein)